MKLRDSAVKDLLMLNSTKSGKSPFSELKWQNPAGKDRKLLILTVEYNVSKQTNDCNQSCNRTIRKRLFSDVLHSILVICLLHQHKCLFIILNWRAKVLPHCQLLKLGKYRNPTPKYSVHSSRGRDVNYSLCHRSVSLTTPCHWPMNQTFKAAATQSAQVQNRLWINLTPPKHTTPLVQPVVNDLATATETTSFKGTRVENY